MRAIWALVFIFALTACDTDQANYEWVDWTIMDHKSAEGKTSRYFVAFAGNPNGNTVMNDAGADNYFAKTPDTFRSREVGEGPATADIIRTYGGERTGRQEFSFSKPVDDPIIAILSLGNSDDAARLIFEKDVELIKSGPGHWGGHEDSLAVSDDNKTVIGKEGYGLIKIPGTHRAIGFTTPDYEGDYGFQIAIR